jgi:hypothetical protein
MRLFLVIGLLFILLQKIAGQNADVTKRNSDEDLKQFTSSIYKYPSFGRGKIILKDSTVIDAKLNCNRVLGKIVYLDRINKALPLENPGTVSEVTVANDTFYIYENSYVQKYTHCSKVNLYIKQSLVYVDKNMPKDNSAPVVISNGSKLPYSNEDEKKEDKGLEKYSQFQLTNEYFIADSSMNYLIASKKSMLDLFPSAREPLKKYFQQNTVSFNNASQIEKLLQYMDAF